MEKALELEKEFQSDLHSSENGLGIEQIEEDASRIVGKIVDGLNRACDGVTKVYGKVYDEVYDGVSKACKEINADFGRAWDVMKEGIPAQEGFFVNMFNGIKALFNTPPTQSGVAIQELVRTDVAEQDEDAERKEHYVNLGRDIVKLTKAAQGSDNLVIINTSNYRL